MAGPFRIATRTPGVQPVRDSKDPEGPARIFGTDAWTTFIADVKAGHYPAHYPVH